MKAIINYLLLFFLFGTFFLNAQSPEIEWQKTFGGSLNDEGYSMYATSDNHLLATGIAYSTDGDINESFGGKGDGWVIKYDNNGNLIWKKAYGGSGSDSIWDIVETDDGNYLFVGSSDSNDGDINSPLGQSDFWLVKINTNGDIIWSKNYGGSDSESGDKIIKNNDGSFIVIGSSFSDDGIFTDNHGFIDYSVIKINASGDVIWSKSFGGTGLDLAIDGLLDSDNNILITGYAYSNDGNFNQNKGEKDIWLLKLNQNGDLLWKKNIGGTDHDESFCLAEDSNGNYIVGVDSRSDDFDFDENYGNMDGWIFKLDKNGNILNKFHFGGSLLDVPMSLLFNSDGDLIIGGITASSDVDVSYNHGNYDFWLLKLNSVGEIVWEKTYGGSGKDQLWGMTNFNGDFAAIGETDSNDGDVSGNHGETDFWILKLNADDMGLDENSLSTINIFPNPFSDKINIRSNEIISSIELTDLNGRMIKKESNSSKNIQLKTSELSQGIYVLKIKTIDGKLFTRKIIKK